MARYVLSDTFTQLNETSGVIENIAEAPVEISSQDERRTGIILYPQQRYLFNGITYVAREQGSVTPAVIAVETNIYKGSGGGGTSSGGSSIDYSPSFNLINQKLQSIEEDVANVDELATETTHQRIADALENLVNKDFCKGNGLSAYEVALGNGFQGTVQEWLASLKGDKGDDGEDGTSPTVKIVTNANGTHTITITDKNGSTTAIISDGAKGDKGDKGDQGIQGIQGEKGDKGDTYTLPIASDSVLGGVKSSTVEGGVTINADGTMKVNPAADWGLLKLDANGYYVEVQEEQTDDPTT